MKHQVVSIVTRRYYFEGTQDECSKWLTNYGGGWSQFEILPYDSGRELGDIRETY